MESKPLMMNDRDYELLNAWETSEKTSESIRELARKRGIKPGTVAVMLVEYGCEDVPEEHIRKMRRLGIFMETSKPGTAKRRKQSTPKWTSSVPVKTRERLIELKLRGWTRAEIEAEMPLTREHISVLWSEILMQRPELNALAAKARWYRRNPE